MEAVRRANPKYTNFKSRTAVDAVQQFCNMQRNGLNAMRIPEALIECAKGLDDRELELFETWIVNPNDVQGMDASVIGAQNHAEHERLLREHEERECTKFSALTTNTDDEKCADSAPLETCAEEKVEEIE